MYTFVYQHSKECVKYSFVVPNLLAIQWLEGKAQTTYTNSKLHKIIKLATLPIFRQTGCIDKFWRDNETVVKKTLRLTDVFCHRGLVLRKVNKYACSYFLSLRADAEIRFSSRQRLLWRAHIFPKDTVSAFSVITERYVLWGHSNLERCVYDVDMVWSFQKKSYTVSSITTNNTGPKLYFIKIKISF